MPFNNTQLMLNLRDPNARLADMADHTTNFLGTNREIGIPDGTMYLHNIGDSAHFAGLSSLEDTA
jgi:hypothetical protein